MFSDVNHKDEEPNKSRRLQAVKCAYCFQISLNKIVCDVCKKQLTVKEEWFGENKLSEFANLFEDLPKINFLPGNVRDDSSGSVNNLSYTSDSPSSSTNKLHSNCKREAMKCGCRLLKKDSIKLRCAKIKERRKAEEEKRLYSESTATSNNAHLNEETSLNGGKEYQSTSESVSERYSSLSPDETVSARSSYIQVEASAAVPRTSVTDYSNNTDSISGTLQYPSGTNYTQPSTFSSSNYGGNERQSTSDSLSDKYSFFSPNDAVSSRVPHIPPEASLAGPRVTVTNYYNNTDSMSEPVQYPFDTNSTPLNMFSSSNYGYNNTDSISESEYPSSKNYSAIGTVSHFSYAEFNLESNSDFEEKDAASTNEDTRLPSTRDFGILKFPSVEQNPVILIYPSINGIEIREKDIETLAPQALLNDTIIDFYMQYIYYEKLSENLRERTYMFSSYFYASLRKVHNGKCPEELLKRMEQQYTRKVDIFSKDFIFIPVNECFHWYLVVVCFIGKLCNSQSFIHVMDASPGSAKSGDTSGSSDDNVLNSENESPCICFFDSLNAYQKKAEITENLQSFLKFVWEYKYGKSIYSWHELKPITYNCPEQDNPYDCGLFVLQYAESFFETPLPRLQNPVPDLSNWFPLRKMANKRNDIHQIISILLDKNKKELVLLDCNNSLELNVDMTSMKSPNFEEQNFFELSNFQNMVLYIYGIEIKYEDISLLCPGNWLNDNIMDFYMKYTYYVKLPESVQKRTHVFNCDFYTSLTRASQTLCSDNLKWSQPLLKEMDIDIFSKDYIFIPINKDGHWCLAVLCFIGEIYNYKSICGNGETGYAKNNSCNSDFSLKNGVDGLINKNRNPCLCFFDSHSFSCINVEKAAEELIRFLKIWTERKKSRVKLDRENFLVFTADCAKEKDRYDCGLYVLQYFESFFKNPIRDFHVPLPDLKDWFPYDSIKNKRAEIKSAIIQLLQLQMDDKVV